MATVGLYPIEDLWKKFGDLKMPPVRVRVIRLISPYLTPIKSIYIKHWAARALCLILLPFLVYLISFKIHFLILNKSGPGDAQMSSLFQANLEGNDFAKNPLRMFSHFPCAVESS